MLSLTAGAQEFTFKADTLTETTAGMTPPQGSSWDNYTINMHNYVRNSTQASLSVQWQIFEKNLPNGWGIYGFCDNATCRTEESAAITSAAVQSALPIAAGDSSLLEPRVKVPVEGDNGVGIIRVRVFTDNWADTTAYIIYKTASGIAGISINDTRVMLYPNPAEDRLSVYMDKNLNAARIDVYSINGANLAQHMVTGKETASIDVSKMAPGLYQVRVADNHGALITSRKFHKK
jgi:hypothetical protein